MWRVYPPCVFVRDTRGREMIESYVTPDAQVAFLYFPLNRDGLLTYELFERAGIRGRHRKGVQPSP